MHAKTLINSFKLINDYNTIDNINDIWKKFSEELNLIISKSKVFAKNLDLKPVAIFMRSKQANLSVILKFAPFETVICRKLIALKLD